MSDIELLKSLVVEHADFPKAGILFYDVLPIFRHPSAFEVLISHLVNHVARHGKIDVVVGLESRGFIVAPILALRLGAAFVPLRKPGKLPGKTLSADFDKEYGKDTVYLQEGVILRGQRVLIFDDLIATGGTARAAVNLITQVKAEPVECLFVAEIAELKGREKLGAPGYSVLVY